MKTLIKTGLILSTLLLFAANAWSLPMTGDIVKMTVNSSPNTQYKMEVTAVGAGSSSQVGDFFNTFCVEYTERFSNGGKYKVGSVSTVATLGGYYTPGTGVNDPYSGLLGDHISDKSLWLYASFFDGVFNNVYKNGILVTGQALVDMVQNAIWYEEEEISSNTDYITLIDLAEGDFTFTGWDIKVVNIISKWNSNSHKQSQLTGSKIPSPVPEPATMMLFGLGLLGLAGIGRKKQKK